jgi:hypothetical protein
MPDLTALQTRQQSLIRKALNGGVWVAPYATTSPTALTSGASADPQTLPVGFLDVGYILKDDGLTFSRAIENSDTVSWGASEPTRRDITSDVDTVSFSMQETKRATLELYHGVNLAALTPTAVTGEVSFTKAVSPQTIYRRFMAICQDGAGTDAIYIGRYHPRWSVTGVEDLQWTDGTEIRYRVTGTAFADSVLGFSTRFTFGGPGWRSALVSMGFPAVA